MTDFIKTEISDGIEVISVPAQRFKTNEIAISLLVPLKKETASVNAIIPMLLSRSSKEYKTFKELNKKLDYLYGAIISPSVTKVGENQLLRIGLACVDDRFSLNDEVISKECIDFLLSLIFEPNFDEDGNFFDDDIQREKNILCQKIDSEDNEKRTYVLRKAEELMFKDEPFAINRYGSKEDVQNITKESALKAWKNILKTSKVLLTLVGNASVEDAKSELAKRFSNIEREYKKLDKAVFVPNAKEVKEHTEKIDVKQGKLVLGFRVNMKPDDENCAAMRSFADIFGGGPYSKLFANVREKMSLCYYCSARYVRKKSFIVIQCGCEEENMDKAVKEILNQLEEIKKGNFEYEFNSSKVGISDAINSVSDASDSLEAWYALQIDDESVISPKQSANENEKVTKEQVIECANLISLDTIYKLVSIKED